MTESAAVLDPRHAIEAAARSTARTLLYTAPVLDGAVALLADLWAAGERHGVHPDQLDVAYACLEAIRPRWRTGFPQTVEEALALLRVLVEEFATLGVTAQLDTDLARVLLPRGPSTPTWGYDHPADPPAPQLAVGVAIGELDGGWDLGLNLRGTRMVDVAALCDRAGAAAVARLAIEVNAGRRGSNLFQW